jgi:hypothetical protein
MSDLLVPHGKEERLIPLLQAGDAFKAETERTKTLKQITERRCQKRHF